jgi:hypothetical protein
MGMTSFNMRIACGLFLPLVVTALIALPACSRAQSGTPTPRVITSSSIVASDHSELPSCQSLECVRRHVGASSTVRMAGAFGRFTGRVTRWDADSLAGLEVDPDWGGSAPIAPIAWSQISNLDKRVSNSGRGAVIGAIALGGLTALFAAATASAANISIFGLDPDADSEINRAALTGGLIGGALGAGIGAGIGAGSHRWILIYRR